MFPKSQENRTDAELVAVCNEGSAAHAAAAFAALYRRHRDYVLRVSMRYSQDRDTAADVLQDTFAYLLAQFPPTGKGLALTARLTTYLFPIAKNFTISRIRKQSRFASDGIDLESVPDTSSAFPRHTRDDIDKGLASLTPERREVLVLRFVDDMSLQEIATALGIPLGTVKSRLHLALAQLKNSPELKDLFEP